MLRCARHKVWVRRCLSLCSRPVPLARFDFYRSVWTLRCTGLYALSIGDYVWMRDWAENRRTRLRNEHNGHGFAYRSRRSGRDVMRLMTSSRDRPLCYSHNVNAKCLILRRFFILKIFQGYFRLSNDLQIRKHTLIPSFLAPFYREKWANARKRRDAMQWLNVHIHQ